MDKNGAKVAIIVVLLIVAGVIFAWQFGLFSGGGEATVPTAPPDEVYDEETYDEATDSVGEDGVRPLPPMPDKPR